MEARIRVVTVAALVLAAIAVAWWAQGHGEPAPPAPPSASAPPTAAGASDPAPASVAKVDREAAAPLRDEMVSTDATLATLRGRGVDENGAPLAGCNVRLAGWPAGSQRLQAWSRDHGNTPDWKDPPAITTGADGRFEFRFWPPPPFQFALRLTRDGRGKVEGQWRDLAEGSTTDVGDVRLGPGVRVTGRVLDEQGVPQAGEYVTLTRQDAAATTDGAIAPLRACKAPSKADGSFAIDDWLPPGEYRVRTQASALVSPKTVTLVAARTHEDLAVVVHAPSAADVITGRVLDETGAPVRDVYVEDRSADGWSRSRTGTNGTFRLERPASATGKTATLLVVTDVYEHDAEAREVAWGTQDVEFRVTRAPTLTVRVTDERGAPVDDYLVRLLPQNRSGFMSSDSRARAQGRHNNGTVVIPGLTRGDWLLMVEFPDESGLGSLQEEFSQDTGPRRLDLRARALQRRTLRVVDGDDHAVAGTRAQLCDPFGATFDADRPVMESKQWRLNAGARNALVLAEVTTDADGRAELCGPGGRDIGVAVIGPGHVPVRLDGVRLDVAEEIVVRVSRGARLVGKVVPPEALTELQRLIGDDARPFTEYRRPRLWLRNDAGATFPKNQVTAQNQANLRIADDGTFAVDGLPPGAWQVHVTAWVLVGKGGMSSESFAANRVELADGRTTTCELDLSCLLPGDVQGVAFWNGQPLANGTFVLQDSNRSATVSTDADGRFATRTVAGDYVAVVQKIVGFGVWSRHVCPTPVSVVRGQTTTVTLTFAVGTLRLSVLDANGRPVAGVAIEAKGSEPYGQRFAPTDERGVAEAELTSESVVLRVLPKALSTPEAQHKLWQDARANGIEDPLAPHWIVLARVTLAAGETTPIELHLPENAGY